MVQCFEDKPEDRPKDAGEFAEQLRALLSALPPDPPPTKKSGKLEVRFAEGKVHVLKILSRGPQTEHDLWEVLKAEQSASGILAGC
jgi:hypothetical protein